MDSGMIALLAVAGLLALAVAGALAWAITRPTRTSRPTPVRLGAQAAAPADLPPPEQLGPYRIGHALGRGAMGVVYLAHDAEDRPVALKTLALASEFDAVGLVEARARFFREAETAQRLRHAGIVTVYGAGEDDGLAWIAMEYLPGEPLEAWTGPTGCCRWPTRSRSCARLRSRSITRISIRSSTVTSSRPTSCTTRPPAKSS